MLKLGDRTSLRCVRKRTEASNTAERIVGARGGGEGYSHTLPIRVCAAQRGLEFEAPDLERGIHFRGVF